MIKVASHGHFDRQKRHFFPASPLLLMTIILTLVGDNDAHQ